MDISKLPKWAQKYIKNISREREVAIKALNEYIDNQTPAPFYIDELESTGEEKGPSTKRRYIQTYKITIEHAGVELQVLLREGIIDLQWHGEHGLKDVAFIPRSYMQAYLVSKKNMN